MRSLIRFMAAALLAAFAAGGELLAHDFRAGSLTIDHPWARATPAGAPVAAGYLVIENRGAAADRLMSVRVDVAARAEIHEMAVQDGVMRMRPLPRGIEIAPGMTAKLEPGGVHLMFFELKQPLRAGDRFKGTLVFEQAGPVEVEFLVEPMGGGQHHHGH